MKRHFLFMGLCLSFSHITLSQPIKYNATLAGHVILPAETTISPPDNAENSFSISGRFTTNNNHRNEQLNSNTMSTGLSLPMEGQPLQGFSGIKHIKDDRFIILTDNGFGRKSNSADSLLYFNIVNINFEKNLVNIEKTIFIKDPNRVVPFPIQTEHSTNRYLTGADFDPESIQPLKNGGFMIGEEFGPYLIELDANGIVKTLHSTVVNDVEFRSPDNPFLDLDNPQNTQVPRSGGYEGMAMSPDGNFLYPMLEKPTKDVSGRFLYIFEFDVNQKKFTRNILKYPLDAQATAIGDFNMINSRYALVIERDNGQGNMKQACSNSINPPCFSNPAKFKRVYLVDIAPIDNKGVVKKLAYIDLLNIQDPNNLAKIEKPEDNFSFPFFTIENVDIVDGEHIIIANDNNYPFSQGRDPIKADNNEFILLNVKEFLSQAVE